MMLQITDPNVGLERWLLVEGLIAEGTRTGGQVPRTHVKPGGHASVHKVEGN